MENSWQVSTAIILVIMIVMFMLVGALIGTLFGFLIHSLTWWNCALFMLAVALLVAVYCYFSPVDPVLKGMNARPADEYNDSRVYRIVRGLAEKAGTPMPAVYVCDVDYPNAFALGRTPDKALVAVTRPLADLLTDDELEGVMGHELSHIIHRDTIVNGIARTSASVLSKFSILMGYAAMIGALALASAKNANAIVLLIMVALTIPVIIVGTILYVAVPGSSAILKFGVSRSREYGADESSARLTGKPMALANALVKMDDYCQRTDNSYKTKTAVAAPLMIVNPFGRKRGSFMNTLFSTHPTTESRVERLIEIDEELNGGTSDPFALSCGSSEE